MANTIKVSVLGDVRDINNKMGSVSKQLTGFGKSASRVGGLLKAAFAAFAVGQVVGGIKSVVNSASDLNETMSKTDAIFGKSSKAIKSWASGAATSMGLSKQEALDGVTTFGNFANQIGLSGKQTQQFSKDLVKAAVDMGSFHNAAPVDVMEALASATRGEFDALQKYVPTINAAAVEQKALTMTGKDLAKELTAQDKAMATHAIVMKGMGKADGDFARTRGSLANQTKIAAAQFNNLKTSIGSALLPVVTKAMNFISTTAIPKMREWYGVFKSELIPAIQQVGQWISTNLLPPLQALGTFLANNKTVVATFVAVILTVVAAMKAWAVIQAILNAVMLANPIGLIVIAIAALAAGLVYAYQKSETFKNIVDAGFKQIKAVAQAVFPYLKQIVTQVFNGIKTYIQGVMNVIKGVIKVVTSAIKGDWSGVWAGIRQIVQGAWQMIKGIVQAGTAVIRTVIGAAWNAVKSLTAKAWNGLKEAVASAIINVVGLARGLPGRVLGALGNLGSLLYNAGKDIIQGLINGIESMIGTVKDKLSDLTDLIPKIKGPPKRDKVLLRKNGQLIIQGLIDGFNDGIAGVKSVLTKMTDSITKYVDKAYSKSSAKDRKKYVKSVLKYLGDETRALIKNAKVREGIYTRLAAAEKTLVDKRKQLSDYAANVANNVIAFGAVTNLNSAFNADAMLQQLKARIAKVKQWGQLLASLARSGLNKTMYDQLVQAGVEGGLATASAIQAGGPAAIREFNALQGQLAAEANALGTSTSRNMYQAGVDAAQGLVNGLKDKARALERIAKELARDLVKAIKKALDINSPSRVFRDIGSQTIKGLEIGLRDTVGVRRAMTSLGHLMEGSLTPQLATTAGGSGDRPNITIQVQGSMVGTTKEQVGRWVTEAQDAYYRSGGSRRA